MVPVQIQFRRLAATRVAAASTAIKPSVTQNIQGHSKMATLKFMPMIPAMTTAGSSSTETIVSRFMISLVAWAVRLMKMSKDPTIISRAVSTESRARSSRSDIR